MKTLLQALLLRAQLNLSWQLIVTASVSGTFAIAALTLLSDLTGMMLLMAPFGATCVLLFSVPSSPLSQPANVIGGHLVSASIGILIHTLIPSFWWAMALAVGLSIGVMAALRVTHPPAGADPIVVFIENLDVSYLIFPVAVGSVILVLFAWAFHSISPITNYPLKIR